MRAGEGQYNSADWNSGSKTVVRTEGSWRYNNLQWRFAARGKLKFSSAVGFPVNTKTSADIWQQSLCSWLLFFPLPCYFIAFISLPVLPGRGSNLVRSAARLPRSPLVQVPASFTLRLFQMWVHAACRLTSRLAPRLNTLLQVDLWMQVGAFSCFIAWCKASVFRLAKLHGRHCKPNRAAFWFLLPGPHQSHASQNRSQCPNLSVSQALVYMSWFVHLGHRGRSFQSCKTAFTSRDWE